MRRAWEEIERRNKRGHGEDMTDEDVAEEFERFLERTRIEAEEREVFNSSSGGGGSSSSSRDTKHRAYRNA